MVPADVSGLLQVRNDIYRDGGSGVGLDLSDASGRAAFPKRRVEHGEAGLLRIAGTARFGTPPRPAGVMLAGTDRHCVLTVAPAQARSAPPSAPSFLLVPV